MMSLRADPYPRSKCPGCRTRRVKPERVSSAETLLASNGLDWATSFCEGIRIDRADHAVVIPVHAESVEDVTRTVRSIPERALAVLVVNAADDAPEEARNLNREVVAAFDAETIKPGVYYATSGRRHVLTLDMVFAGYPSVGMARRAGCFLACALTRRGVLDGRWIFQLDADSEMSADPTGAIANVPVSATGAVFPTEIVPASGLEAQAARLQAFRAAHLLLCRWARCPYFLDIGAPELALDATAYVRVGGHPPIASGEDCVLAERLVRLGPIWQVPGPVVRTSGRCSDRTPIGLGRAIAASEGAVSYAPYTYLRDNLQLQADVGPGAMALSVFKIIRLLSKAPAPPVPLGEFFAHEAFAGGGIEPGDGLDVIARKLSFLAQARCVGPTGPTVC